MADASAGAEGSDQATTQTSIMNPEQIALF